MSEVQSLFIFCLDSVRYAVYLAAVERVLRAVEITPLPLLVGNISGIINMNGLIVPVVNTRRMLGLSEREIVLDDVFIIVRTGTRIVALIADNVEQVAEIQSEHITLTDNISLDLHRLSGIARLKNNIILIHDLEQCISAEEAVAIDLAIDEAYSP